MTGSPADVLDRELERLRRLTGLRVDTLTRAVTALDDTVGWDRLTMLGTRATIEAQTTAVTAVTEYLTGILDAAGVPSFGITVPIQPGVLPSGRPVYGMFSVTRDVVRHRVGAGMEFVEAQDRSANFLVGKAASEPHRIGRDGPLATGLQDPRFDRFQRIAEPGACQFCKMLATRGAVYLTAETAGQGRRFHSMCRCGISIEPSPEAVAASTRVSRQRR